MHLHAHTGLQSLPSERRNQSGLHVVNDRQRTTTMLLDRALVTLVLVVLLSAFPLHQAYAIVGGQDAPGAQWDFSLLIKMDGATCSATVIRPYIVLTAAHCVVDDDGKQVPEVTAITRNKEVPLEIIHIDGKYLQGDLSRDIALLRSAEPFETVFPGSLMSAGRYSGLVFGKRPGKTLAVIGYGINDDETAGKRKIFFSEGYAIGVGPLAGSFLQAHDRLAGSIRPGDSGSGVLFNDSEGLVLGAVVSALGTLNQGRNADILTRIDPKRPDYDVSFYSPVVPTLCEAPVDVRETLGFDASECSLALRADRALRNVEGDLDTAGHLWVHRVTTDSFYSNFALGYAWHYYSYFAAVRSGFRTSPRLHQQMVSDFRSDRSFMPFEWQERIRRMVLEIDRANPALESGAENGAPEDVERALRRDYFNAVNAQTCAHDSCLLFFEYRAATRGSHALDGLLGYENDRLDVILAEMGAGPAVEEKALDFARFTELACPFVSRQQDWNKTKELLGRFGIAKERMGMAEKSDGTGETMTIRKLGASGAEASLWISGDGGYEVSYFPVRLTDVDLARLGNALEAGGFYRSRGSDETSWISGASVRVAHGRTVRFSLRQDESGHYRVSVLSETASELARGESDTVMSPILQCVR